MNGKIAELPWWEVRFDMNGAIETDNGLSTDAEFGTVQDLFVFSHGWNTSINGARNLNNSMFSLIADQLTPEQRTKAGVVGVLWPSLLFPEDGPSDDGSPGPTEHSTGAELATALAPAFPEQATELQTIGGLLDDKPQVGAELENFYGLTTGLATTPAIGGPEDHGEQSLINAPPTDALNAMAASPGAPAADTQGVNPFTTLWHGARELLRTMSYYEMKNRAGVIGQNGLGPLLGRLHEKSPNLRVHLIGHSFGARLVAFSLPGLPASATGVSSPVKSLVLVQGAFSHFTFSHERPGALQAFADRVDGPLVATLSAHDRAVGLWYPNASRLARQDNQSLFDFNERWGGMGHDGYQQAGARVLELGSAGTAYPFSKSAFFSLKASGVINRNLSLFSGAHSDICHPEVAWAAVSAAGV
jgi:hypothetical protein